MNLPTLQKRETVLLGVVSDDVCDRSTATPPVFLHCLRRTSLRQLL